MKVKQLISRLKKMPQDLEVYYSHHDNREYETAGTCDSVMLLVKSDYDNTPMPSDERACLDHSPDRCVVIRG